MIANICRLTLTKRLIDSQFTADRSPLWICTMDLAMNSRPRPFYHTSSVSEQIFQFSNYRVPRVAASCPVSPTSSHSFKFPHPINPSAYRTFSSDDGFHSYQRPLRSQYSTDDDSLRQFQSLPRQKVTSGGIHSTSMDIYDPYSARKHDSNSSVDPGCFTMPKPSPYRPSNVQASSADFRSGGSDSSGYQTSYSPTAVDLTTGNQLQGARFPANHPSRGFYGPGPGISPPSYEKSLSERNRPFSPLYNRQDSSYGSNGSHSDQKRIYESPHFAGKENVVRPPHQLVRQTSREQPQYNDYQSDLSSVRSNVISPSSEYSRSPNEIRHLSYESNVQSPTLGRADSSMFLIGNSQPRVFQRNQIYDEKRVEERPVIQYQRQTSSGTLPKYESTISSPPLGHHPKQDGEKPEPPVRSHSFDHRVRKPSHNSSTGINSIEDILSPFEKFQSSSYFKEFYDQDQPISPSTSVKSNSFDTSSFRSPPTNDSPSVREREGNVTPYYNQGVPKAINSKSQLEKSVFFNSNKEDKEEQNMTSHNQFAPPPCMAPPPPPPPPPPPLGPTGSYGPGWKATKKSVQVGYVNF